MPDKETLGEGHRVVSSALRLEAGARSKPGSPTVNMSQFRKGLIGAVCLIASASPVACTRASEGVSPGSAGSTGRIVGEDVKGVAKATEKVAKDIGHATVDLGDKARKSLEEVTDNAGKGAQDAWITTQVKSELTRVGLDPLHVHVDTEGKVVTLAGTVDSASEARKAVRAAKAVKDALGVQDHLFVKPAQRQR